ncbi:MAG TPA: 2-dehydropantoate 2-reductase [Vicinamibacterales bacterium]|nr:2-dehydropantoate 2-reductase [Vicinamibacterales bacterium]
MHVVVVGAGAVGGYFGALLARAGERVTFLARGAHLHAIRANGLAVRSPLGDFVVHCEAVEDPARAGEADVVLFTVKTYDNPVAARLLPPLLGERGVVLTLQNGVDSTEELAAVVGARRVLAGAAYVATALVEPGIIEQTGTHRRIVFGEVFGDPPRLSDRVLAIREALERAGVDVEAVADARGPLWEKFVYLAPFSGFTAAARLPIGPLWQDDLIRSQLMAAFDEVASVAAAEGIELPDGAIDRIRAYTAALPPATRSSLLVDLAQGRRLEVESLQGSVVRRAARAGVAVPIMTTLYALLKPYAEGA